MALVVWSGGCDSTLVLYDLARQSTKDKPVRTISITHSRINAVEEQRKARQRLLKKFKSMGFHVTNFEVNIQVDDAADMNISGLPQPAIWLTTAMHHLQSAEDLYFGYIREDDMWHYWGWFHCIFKDLSAILDNTGNLLLPLRFTNKYTVIQRLSEAGLLPLVWTCETPTKHKKCGKCDPCRKYAMSLTHLERYMKWKPGQPIPEPQLKVCTIPSHKRKKK